MLKQFCHGFYFTSAFGLYFLSYHKLRLTGKGVSECLVESTESTDISKCVFLWPHRAKLVCGNFRCGPLFECKLDGGICFCITDSGFVNTSSGGRLSVSKSFKFNSQN